MKKLAPNRHEVNLIKKAVQENPKISATKLAEVMNIDAKAVTNHVTYFKKALAGPTTVEKKTVPAAKKE